MMTLAVIVTMLTAIDYVLRAHKLRNTSPRAQLERERRAVAAREAVSCEKATDEDVAREDVAREDVAREDVAREDAAREDAARHTAGSGV
jgi:DNA-binding transcriptional regulator YdaS (Cro superfamily)